VAASAATERSVAQTRSFTSMMLVGQAIAARLAGVDAAVMEGLPSQAQRLLAAARPLVSQLAQTERIANFYFLGSGPLFGVASEGMLKLKEMSLTGSEAFHTLEFRHGPMSMCDETAAVVGLITPERTVRETAVLDDVRAFGTKVVSLGAGLDIDIHEASPWARSVLYLIPLQLLALERALAKQLDPDQPRHLTAVIHLDPAPGHH